MANQTPSPIRSLRHQLISVAALALLACQSDSTPTSTPPSPGAPAVIVLSAHASSVHQQETTLAQASNGRTVVVWMGSMPSGNTTIEYAISDDAGTTWSDPKAIPIPSQLRAFGDPAIAADSSGNFILAVIGAFYPHQEIDVFRLAAGASSFGAPLAVTTLDSDGSDNIDKTQVVVTSAGYLVTYTVNRAHAAGIAATSADGVNWRRDTIATNAPVFLSPCADGQGVTAVYYDNVGGGLWAASSTNGGMHWTTPIKISASATLSSMPACVRRGNEVWILYGTNPTGVHILHSADGGVPVINLIDLTATNPLYGSLALRGNGTLDVGYYQTTGDVPFGFAHSTFASGSTTGSYELIRKGMTFPHERFGPIDVADYVGVIPGGIAFTDNSSGTSHIAFFRTPK